MAMRKTFSIRKTVSSPSRSARRHAFLGSVARKCTAVVSELDPVMHIMLYRLTLGRVDGPLISKDMLVCTGVIALMLVEELI